MKKLLVGLFIVLVLVLGIRQVQASTISDTLTKIQNLQKEISKLKTTLKGSVGEIPEPPILGSTVVQNITSNGATFYASVNSPGYPAKITARGFCYGLVSEGPMRNCTDDSISGVGLFSQIEKELNPNTEYLVVSYARNDTGMSYGGVASFKTQPSQNSQLVAVNGGWTSWSNTGSCVNGYQQQSRTCTNPSPANGGSACTGSTTQSISCSSTSSCPADSTIQRPTTQSCPTNQFEAVKDLNGCTIAYKCVASQQQSYAPTLTSPKAQSITKDSAVLSATITDLGYPTTITERGVCYGRTLSSTPSLNKGDDCQRSSSAQTMITAKYLDPNTTYKFRAYAINGAGVGYSEEGTFKTLADSITTPSITVLSPN